MGSESTSKGNVGDSDQTTAKNKARRKGKDKVKREKNKKRHLLSWRKKMKRLSGLGSCFGGCTQLSHPPAFPQDQSQNTGQDYPQKRQLQEQQRQQRQEQQQQSPPTHAP